ncbi:helix-turn-helix domain-containing protein [Streptomyces cyaneofuscatus]|uniref:helix-turn-helix domain-containing protein n=1 Tax=Streptomyces TaxID=1883 RepID=UPI0037B5E72A
MGAGAAPDDEAARRLGAELRALQQRSGRTLRDLETRVRISDSSLSRYFRGTTVPPAGRCWAPCSPGPCCFRPTPRPPAPPGARRR